MKYRIVLEKPTGHIILDTEKPERMPFVFYQNSFPYYLHGNQWARENLIEHSKTSQSILMGDIDRKVKEIKVESS